MTWTYSGDPSSTTRDAVRFAVGDTDSTYPLVTDEEIAYAVSEYGSVPISAAMICDALAARYAQDVDVSNGSASESASQRAAHYATLAGTLRRRAYQSATLIIGGQTTSEDAAIEANSDRKPNLFRLRQFDGGADWP